jgi:predicted acyltransferase
MIHYLKTKTIYIISALILLGYWALLLMGGDMTMLGNFGTKLDIWLIGESHMYRGEGVAFDPEGFISTFPSVVNVLIGYYTGVALRDKGKEFETIAKILLAGVALMAIAYCWNYLWPINKKLWSGSFVLYTCGADLMIIGALVYILDKTAWNQKWIYFFQVFGKNPLFIYIISGLIPDIMGLIKISPEESVGDYVSHHIFQGIAHGAWGTFFYSMFIMLMCWLVGWIMDKRKIYVRV